LLCSGIAALVIFGVIKLLVWQWANNLPPAAYPSFAKLILEGINTSALNAGFPLGILITKKYYEEQARNTAIEQKRKEGELNLLRSQVNPHFLFNSLNTLDALIESNPPQAQTYLKALSKMYRNLIMTKDQEIIPLSQELETLKNYITMIKIRFGNTYHFEITDRPIKDTEFMPVAALQILVENVVTHNKPSSSDTILTSIEIGPKLITVENNKVNTGVSSRSLGTGLKNLKDRYQLVTNEQITINRNDALHFSISIPIIRLKEN